MDLDDNVTDGEMDHSDKENIKREEDCSPSLEERPHDPEHSKPTRPIDRVTQEQYVHQIDAILAAMPFPKPPRKSDKNPALPTKPATRPSAEDDSDEVITRSEALAMRSLDTPNPHGTSEDEVELSLDVPRQKENDNTEKSTVDVTGASLEESMYVKWRCCRCRKINSMNIDPEVCSTPGCLHYFSCCDKCLVVEQAE